MTTETKAAFARRHGVNRSTVNRWETKGHLAMTSDGLVDVETSEQQLVRRAAIYRGGAAKGPAAQVAVAATQPAADPAEMAIEGLGAVVRRIGAFAAQIAIDFGAPLQAAYALDQAVCIEAAIIADEFLTVSGVPGFSHGWSILEYQGRNVDEPNWSALAQQAGQELDEDALSLGLDQHPYFQPKTA